MSESKEAGGKPRRLGRGIGSLINLGPAVRVELPPHPVAQHVAHATIAPPAPAAGPAPVAAGRSATTPAGGDAPGFVMVEVARVMGNSYQPRRVVHDGTLNALADSIKRTGLMQPIIVRPLPPEPRDSRYDWELVAGERRLRAAEIAGVLRLPALVRRLSDEESAEWALVENVQREDLNPIDRAAAFQRLATDFNLTHAQIAERVGLERSTIANLVRLVELEDSVQDLVAQGSLTMGHARALLGWPPGPRRIALAERVAAEGWSVRRLEQAFHQLMAGSPSIAPVAARPAPVVEIEKRLAEHLGTKVEVRVDKSGKRGTVVIRFYDVDHFDGLLSKMGMKD
ncbi:MAG: ParB/RepB/Spo0J family partition protein [Phycisphaerales bacterium]|nr:ParB/RepB/Spo0J family partition protein [Phycisphaerales bacterium]